MGANCKGISLTFLLKMASNAFKIAVMVDMFDIVENRGNAVLKSQIFFKKALAATNTS